MQKKERLTSINNKRTDLTVSPFSIQSKIQIGMTLNFT